MPLVIICGPPCSGKTRRAEQLAGFLRESGQKVTVVNNESLGVVRSDAYASPSAEKICRGNMKAAVERGCTKDSVLISDDLNYIKGYRYELFCIARALGTSCCTIHCTAQSDQISANNSQKGDSKYQESQIVELPMRFERPNDRNRWERPLFEVAVEDESLPVEDIAHVLAGHELKANLATVTQPVSGGNLLHEVDATAQSIITYIQQQQTERGGSSGLGKVMLPSCEKEVCIDVFVPVGELRRIKRQFLKVFATDYNTEKEGQGAGDLFAKFLLGQLRLD